jgi:hypothetical protein
MGKSVDELRNTLETNFENTNNRSNFHNSNTHEGIAAGRQTSTDVAPEQQELSDTTYYSRWPEIVG